MPLYLRIKLTEAEKEELLKLKQAAGTPVRTRTRIETLILSDKGVSVKQIGEVMKQKENTIRKTIKRWEAGYIKLKYLDEAGFCLSSPVSYSYSKKGKQKLIKQPKKRGKRLSILGILAEKESFEYGLKLGGFKRESYLKMMNWQAEKAEENFKKTGQITVIVLDNYSVHRSQEVKKHLEKWREKGLEFFFISAYSPELNLIEPEWHQLKTHELSGRMFEDEYDLAIAVIEAIEKRSQRNNYVWERFRFT